MYIKDGVTWFEIGDRVELLVDYHDGNDDLVRGSMGCVTVERTALAFIPAFDDRDTEYDLESEQELMSMLGVST